MERREPCFHVHTYLPPRPPQLLWSADVQRKHQCSFKGKDPQVSRHRSASWAAGGVRPGPEPRTEAGPGAADADSCAGQDLGCWDGQTWL